MSLDSAYSALSQAQSPKWPWLTADDLYWNLEAFDEESERAGKDEIALALDALAETPLQLVRQDPDLAYKSIWRSAHLGHAAEAVGRLDR